MRVEESVIVDRCDLSSLLGVLLVPHLSHICLNCRNFISLSQGYGYHRDSWIHRVGTVVLFVQNYLVYLILR